MSLEKEIEFNMHTALMMSVKERIRELELALEEATSFRTKESLQEAKEHNEKLLVNLIACTISMTPPTRELH